MIFEKGKDKFEKVLEYVTGRWKMVPSGKWEVSIDKPMRTIQQNNSYHKFAEIFSAACKKEDKQMTIKFCGMEIDVHPTAHQIKENIFKPYIKERFKKTSSKELTMSEMSDLADVMQRAASMNGMDVEWPSEERKQFDNFYNT